MKQIVFLFLIAFSCMVNSANATTYYVDASKPDNAGAGTSWVTAKKDLQQAINLAALSSNNEVWVKAGTYLPTENVQGSYSSNNRFHTFYLKDGVKLYGGFAGTETALSQRVPGATISILSGDLNGDDFIANSGTFIGNQVENAYHVIVVSNGTNGGVTIDGFTIQGGKADFGLNLTANGNAIGGSSGGGIYLYGGTNVISNNTIYANSANYGGGVYSTVGNITFNNNTIIRNFALNEGGGVYFQGYNNPFINSFTNNVFSGNSTVNPLSVGFAGAISILGGTNTIRNNTFYENSAPQGGALYINNSTNTIINSIFWNNKQAGNNNVLGADIKNGTGASNTVTRCLTQQNSQYSSGTGMINNQNPLFVNVNDLAGADGIHRSVDDGLALLFNSPAINMGANAGVTVTDITGAPRIVNTTVDMGAYELQCATASSISQNICQGLSYTFNGIAQTLSGTYKDTLINAAGCDSVVTLNLTVAPLQSAIYENICTGSSFVFNGITQTTGGIYSDTLVTAAGCDSIITLHLTVKPPITAQVISLPTYRCGHSNTIKLQNVNGYSTITTLNGTTTGLPSYSTSGSVTYNNSTTYHELTNAANQNGAIIYTPTSIPSAGFTAYFSMHIYNSQSTTSQGAYGMSFNFGEMLISPTGHENGLLNGNGLVIRFKDYQTQYIEVVYNGVVKGAFDFDIHSPLPREVCVAASPDGKLSISIGNKIVCKNVDLGPSYAGDNKANWKFAWGARTGSAFYNHFINGIVIYDNKGISFSTDNFSTSSALPVISDTANTFILQSAYADCPAMYTIDTIQNNSFDIGNFVSVNNTYNANCNGRTISLVPGLATETLLWSDFSSRPTLSNFSNLGDATFNGTAQLTPNIGGKNGRIIFPVTPNAGVFTAYFKARVWDGNNADGFSFNYGNIDNPTGAEGGMMNTNTPGLSICFPTWNTNNIVVKYKNVVLTTAANTNSGGNRTSLFTPIDVTVDAQYRLYVRWNGVFIITNYDLAANSTYETDAKDNWSFAWGARTGGSFDKHEIDDITITGKTGLLYSYDGGITFETATTKIITNPNPVTILVKAEGCPVDTLSLPVVVITTPTFNQVGPICSGAPNITLPGTSLNGIIGSWSPAINNLVTTLYTFTPYANQCSTNASMTIVVAPEASSFASVNATPKSICAGDSSLLNVVIQGKVSTLTGVGSPSGIVFNTPYGVVTDLSGNIYVAEANAHRIRKITFDGNVSTFAGSGVQGSANGNGINATFNQPQGLAIDAAGNIYVADRGNNKIRKITPWGDVSNLAGSGSVGSVNGTGASASFWQPIGVATDALGNVFVTDAGNHKIRKITPAGVVTNFAGFGNQGSANGIGTNATFNSPNGIAIDSAGNFFISDLGNHRIRKITPAGEVTTFAGQNQGNIDGLGIIAQFSYPTGICVDATGNVYVSEYGNKKIRRISPTGGVTTLAGGTQGNIDGIGAAARFNEPYGLTTDAIGNLYVADYANNRIRKIGIPTQTYTWSPSISTVNTTLDNTKVFPTEVTTYTVTATTSIGCTASGMIKVKINLPASITTLNATPNIICAGDTVKLKLTAPQGGPIVSTFAGSGTIGGANGTGSTAGFYNPSSLATDKAGNMYVADVNNHRIRKITQAGVVSTFAGSGTAGSKDSTGIGASFNLPIAVATDTAGNVFVSDRGNRKIRKITPAGVVSTYAGSGALGNSNGSSATTATFNSPFGIAIDTFGNVYMADDGNHNIRKIIGNTVYHLTGSINGISGSIDGISSNASFSFPSGIAIDANGIIYVADRGNNKIRKVVSNGVTTYAGSGTGFADGPASTAQFSSPWGVTTDAEGNVYVADGNNQRIRKITTTGVVSTIAGSSTQGSADSIGTMATFNNPYALTIDESDNIYVADYGNHKIRKITILPTQSYAWSPLTSSLTTIADSTKAFPIATTTYTVKATNNLGCRTTSTVDVTVNTVYDTIHQTICEGDSYTFNGMARTTSGFYHDTLGNALGCDSIRVLNLVVNPVPIMATISATPNSICAGDSANLKATTASSIVSSITGFINFTDIASDAYGNKYVVDQQQNNIRKVTQDGIVTIFAGSGTAGSADGLGLSASFNSPTSIATDVAGNLYVTDYNNYKIRKITSDGVVSTIAGTGVMGNQNGTTANATFSSLTAIAIDTAGNIYVSDNNRIRKIAASGLVTAFAGTGLQGSTDGSGSIAQFDSPNGLTTDISGNIFVADGGNHKIRKITPAGVVTTFAGSSTSGSADGIGSSASFSYPADISSDTDGNLYVSDYSNHKIRKVTPTGAVTTIVGLGVSGHIDGIGSVATFYYPRGITIDANGHLFVIELSTNMLRKIVLLPTTTFNWSPSSSVVHTVADSTKAFPSLNTVYTVTATDYLGCSASSTVQVTVNPNYTITASAGANGNISPDGNVFVCSGSNKIYTMTPDANYLIEDVLVDGISVGAVSSYTFTNVNTTHTISASFALDCATSSTLTQSICAGSSYMFNGIARTATGIYKDTLVNAANCDSVITLNLTVHQATSNTTLQTACNSYTWFVNGATYTTSGIYSVTSTNAAGCVHTQNLNLTINLATSTATSQSACDSYTWPVNGATYTADGTYSFTSMNAAGCVHTQNLNVTIHQSTSNTTTQIACDSYTWPENGATYTTSGTYSVTSLNAADCVHTEIVSVTNHASTSITTSATACDAYTWSENGTTYSASGTYTATSTNAVGCVHTETLVLIINNSSSNTTAQSVCDAYTWSLNGSTYTASGIYAVTSVNSSGCVHSENLDLTIKPNYVLYASAGLNGTITPSGNDTVCEGVDRTYTMTANSLYHIHDVLVDGVSVGAVGTYTFTNITSAHTISAGFALNCSTTYGTINQSICQGSSFTFNGIALSTAGSYVDTFINAGGCDSIVTLYLTVNSSSTNGNATVTDCDSYTWSGVTYTASGAYTYTSLNASGCVNTATLTLTIKASSTTNNNLTICQHELPYIWNGLSLMAAGTHTAHFTNSVGCDSAATLMLSITPSIILDTITITSCGSFTWNGTTYTSSGSYFSSANCMVHQLNLTITHELLLSAKAFLKGAYDAGLGMMRDSLRVKGLIPITEPYTGAPFGKAVIAETAGETVSPGVLGISGDNAIVDWVFVELRSSSNPATVVATKRALIQRDGDIVSAADGVSPVAFFAMPNDNYYVAIKHRNHLGVMSSSSLNMSECTTAVIDFTTAPSVYTNPMIVSAPRKQIGSVYTLWSGDANNNKNVKYNGISNDKDAILAALGGVAMFNNTLHNTYRSEDSNMDGKVRYNNTDNDRTAILENVGPATPNTILNQHTPN